MNRVAPGRLARLSRSLVLNARDTLVLLAQFRGALTAFALTILIGGSAYYGLARQAGAARPATIVEGWFVALSMIFLQADVEFPPEWYLEVFFFLMPVLGLAILGQGAADFGVLLFNRQARGEAWQMAVAETYSKHIVVVGLGHLGFRIARALNDLGESFVAVQLDPDAELVSQVLSWNVPIINGDATRREVLLKAGVDRAHTIVIATSDDTMNLQIAVRARALNPHLRAIVRLFDDDFARDVREAFGITAAYSASALAAPAFAAAAADLQSIQSITLNGRTLNLSRFVLTERSPLVGESIEAVENQYDVSAVMLRRGGQADLHPPNETILLAADELTLFADNATLHTIQRLNRA